jgi:hypothetical protein
MDRTIEDFSSWLQVKCITYSLVSWHWITHLWSVVQGYTATTVRGIRNAHIPDQWIFRERNECPWVIKEGLDEFQNLLFTNVATWSPCRSRLYFREVSTEFLTNHSFNDVVVAEIYTPDKSLQYDMSSFFHEFSWRSASLSPSLYEIVLLFCLTNNLLFSKSQLEEFTLEVMTADGETLQQRLDSPLAMDNFLSWDMYAKQEEVDVNSLD